jgi:glyoxylase-like metal-dependent hydrolase (beta-lactamase superfamily II)
VSAVPAGRPEVRGFFDPVTSSLTYVVSDPASRRAVVIDPVLDFDPRSGRTRTTAADAVIAHVREEGLTVDWLLETHCHADHLTAAPHLKQALGGRLGIGENIAIVQATFARIFNAEPAFRPDGSQFEHLFRDGEVFEVGAIAARVMATPGHTPACVTYLIGDAAFIGDTLFMPDHGTARCDFPGGDAAVLYRSIRALYALPEATRLFVCHDYQPGGRELRFATTVGEQRAANVHLKGDTGEEAFIALRTARDKTLDMPTLILPAVQVNMRAGQLPPPEANGVSYLKLPVNLF